MVAKDVALHARKDSGVGRKSSRVQTDSEGLKGKGPNKKREMAIVDCHFL